MPYRQVWVLVEGADDERFFEHILEPLLRNRYDHAAKWPYASVPDRKIKAFIKSISAVNADYWLLGDINSSPCITSKRSTLTDTFHTMTLIPVADPVAADLSGVVLVDRVDFFTVAREVKEEGKKKDGEKDYDGDGLINAFDNCPKVANPRQIDSNDDEKGDACDDRELDPAHACSELWGAALDQEIE